MTKTYMLGEIVPKKKDITNEEYVQAAALIRSLPYLKDRRTELLEASAPPPDGQPKGKGGTGDPTGERGSQLAEVERRIKAIEDSLEVVPESFRGAVVDAVNGYATLQYIVYKHRLYCDVSTLSRYKTRYIAEVAYRAEIVI